MAHTLNIVELIEKNPITRLSNTYNTKLLYKIKSNFTDFQQQLFVSSFYCYLNYNKDTDFVIDLDNVWGWLGFNQKSNCKVLLEKNFEEKKDYRIIAHAGSVANKSSVNNSKIFAHAGSVANNSTENKDKNNRGGHNKETILLTVKTFKSMCLKSQTKKAHEIHEYYMKMEELLQQAVEEESNELKMQLQQQKEIIENQKQKEIELTKKLHTSAETEKQKVLMSEYGSTGPLIYIIKVKSFENGEYIIKIGESRRGVRNRFNDHKHHYGDVLLLDCFLVDKSKDFESFLHKHPKIRPQKVTTLEGHETEHELFLIGGELSYAMVLQIINDNINTYKYYSYSEIEKIQNECEKLKQKDTTISVDASYNIINSINNKTLFSEEFNDIKKQNQFLIKKIENLENIQTKHEKSFQEILNKLNSMQTRTTTGFNEPLPTIGPRLQKINPDTMQLIKTYETVTECMKEDHKIKRPSLNKAIMENTIYFGFRWLFVDRELPPDVIHRIEPTKKTKIQNLGYIAKLNESKTEILNVYLDRKTAAHFNGYISPAALDNHVKKETLTNGNYYMLYDNCSAELQNAFCEKHGIKEIVLYKEGVGQFDENNQLVREFMSKYDCSKLAPVGEKTLTKAINNNTMYNKCYYRLLGSKLKCV
jgi:hypothetical protein